MFKNKSPFLWLGLGAAMGTTLTALKIGKAVLQGDQIKRLLQPQRGQSYFESRQNNTYTVTHTIADGIERITCTPHQRRFETPILMQHGMWHGAWCWQPWQGWLAEWGWESTAISLPGHGQSPEQRAIMLCTLEYYLSFLKAEVERLPRKPVLMGHSMGGALVQWYLKYVGDDLPAAVLAAPWNAFDVLQDSFARFVRLQPLAVLQTFFSMTASPLVNTPQKAARALLSPDSAITPRALHAQLGAESALILFEHRPPRWTPPANLNTPTLLLAGEADAVVSLDGLRQSATHLAADFISIPAAGHNLMFAHNAHDTAQHIHTWLSTRLS